MAKEFTVLILLANLLALNCQEEESLDVLNEQHVDANGKPSYSFSYGVSDVHTGDIKTVWETKEGDTVKGHYSVVEPDGTVRSVEYSAGPNTGFTANVINDGLPQPQPQPIETGRNFMEDKTIRDYGKYYDFPDEMEDEFYERRRTKRPHDSHRETLRKRPSYAFDLEPSEYTHSITIKHPRDESSPDAEAHSHVGYSFDPNCKTKKKETDNLRESSYGNDVDLDKPRYPNYAPESYKETYDKYSEPSNYAFDKIKPYESYKLPKYEEPRPDSSMKYNYPTLPDIPEKYYPDDLPPRPKKKRRPQKVPQYASDDLDDYILVPKKKYNPVRNPDTNDYRPEFDDEYDRPYGYDDEDRYRPVRENSGPKEVVRKVVKKKKKPVINLLDIFDI